MSRPVLKYRKPRRCDLDRAAARAERVAERAAERAKQAVAVAKQAAAQAAAARAKQATGQAAGRPKPAFTATITGCDPATGVVWPCRFRPAVVDYLKKAKGPSGCPPCLSCKARPPRLPWCFICSEPGLNGAAVRVTGICHTCSEIRTDRELLKALEQQLSALCRKPVEVVNAYTIKPQPEEPPEDEGLPDEQSP